MTANDSSGRLAHAWTDQKLACLPNEFCDTLPSRYLPALKAPAFTSSGQRPGFPNQSIVERPEGAQGSSALSGRAIIHGHDPRGVAPGLLPPRRWRDNLASPPSAEGSNKAM